MGTTDEMNSDAPFWSIRSAGQDDVPVIVTYNMELAIESEAKELDGEILTRGVHALLSHPERGRYFLAERDGRVIGQIMITFEWSDWRCAMFWWIQSVYVHPDHRQSGVFRSLYEHVAKTAREDGGVCGLRLYVESENQAALAAYRRMGMTAAGYHVYQHDWSGAVRQT
ncbi:MAG: GNAT family N-acetyltransferase [Pirellulales bacterium]